MEDIATSSSRKVYTHEDYITLVLRNGETVSVYLQDVDQLSPSVIFLVSPNRPYFFF